MSSRTLNCNGGIIMKMLKRIAVVMSSLTIFFSVSISTDIGESSVLFKTNSITASASSSKDFSYVVGSDSEGSFVTITGYSGNDTELVFPSTLNGYKVKAIALSTGYGVQGTNIKKITSITVPSGVTSIGPYAFQNCTLLSKINLPVSLKSIGHYAFKGCTSLGTFSATSLTNLSGIGTGAFQNCTNLTTFNIRNTAVKSTSSGMLSGCTKLSGAYLPNITLISSSTFENCSSLVSISIPNTVTTIDSCAFRNCTSLKNALVSSSSNLKAIRQMAFKNCKSLNNFTFPGNTEKEFDIDQYAFSGCTSLKYVILGKCKSYDFGVGAFSGCTSFSSITFPKRNNADDLDGIAFSKDCFLNTPYYTSKCISGVYPSMSNRGSAANCTGKQLVVSVFLNATVNGSSTQWSSSEKTQKNQNVLTATTFIRNQSVRYDTNVYFNTAVDSSLEVTVPNNNLSITVPSSGVVSSITVNGKSQSINTYMREYINSTDFAPDKLKQQYNAQGVTYVLFIKYDGRSSAYCIDNNFDLAKVIRLGTSSANDTSRSIAHELMHCYGAPDAYSESNDAVDSYSSNRYFYDLMRVAGPSLKILHINTYAAYCVGWTNTLFKEDAEVYNFS